MTTRWLRVVLRALVLAGSCVFSPLEPPWRRLELVHRPVAVLTVGVPTPSLERRG